MGANRSGQAYVAGADPSQYMNNALKTSFMAEQREIYPTLNYFRTEEKQSNVIISIYSSITINRVNLFSMTNR